MSFSTTPATDNSGSSNSADPPSKTLCRYFMNGACKLGDRCHYSHNRSDQPEMVCRYYLQGACSYGSQCRYDHVKAAKQQQQQKNAAPQRNLTPSTSTVNAVVPATAKSPASAAAASSLAANATEEGTTTTWNTIRPPTTTSATRNGYYPIVDYDHWDEVDDDPDLGLVSLNKPAAKSKSTDLVKTSKLRAEAKEFVPTFQVNYSPPPSYASAVAGSSLENGGAVIHPPLSLVPTETGKDLICPYYIMGECHHQADSCEFTHGLVCDLCNQPVLHPQNDVINGQHRKECAAEREREMELAFALAKGDGKPCGICLEVVMEKANPSSRRFGILPGCKHCYCLDCIRKWRRAGQSSTSESSSYEQHQQQQRFENKVVRACPECRVQSDFVIPSTVWVEEEDEKRALLDTYQSSVKQKVCKYFRGGETECPFGNKCFYRHVRPDGTVVQGDSPRTIRRRNERLRRAHEGAGPSSDYFLLWDFFAVRSDRGGGLTGLDLDDDDDDDMLYDMLLLAISNDESADSSID